MAREEFPEALVDLARAAIASTVYTRPRHLGEICEALGAFMTADQARKSLRLLLERGEITIGKRAEVSIAAPPRTRSDNQAA